MDFIKLQGVGKSYQGEPILKRIDLTIQNGEFVSIVGPYGSGKTTILRIMSGLINDYTGSIAINGSLPSNSLKNRKIGYAFQNASLFPWLSVEGNLKVVQKIANKNDTSVIDELLKLGDLEKYRSQQISNLSGGMRQVLSILRALVLNPDILILDEPLSSIDELSREKFQDILADIHRKTKKTTIMVTHSLDEALYLSDRIVVLSKKPTTIKEIFNIGKADGDRYSEKFTNKLRLLRQALK